jgi:mediator of RNA polymerase II transcription subunit 7
VNAHHLINTYRPHQARESLIVMMESQLAEGRKETEQCEKMKKKVEERLQFMARSVPDAGVGRADKAIDQVVPGKSPQQTKIRRMWGEIYALDDT